MSVLCEDPSRFIYLYWHGLNAESSPGHRWGSCRCFLKLNWDLHCGAEATTSYLSSKAVIYILSFPQWKCQTGRVCLVFPGGVCVSVCREILSTELICLLHPRKGAKRRFPPSLGCRAQGPRRDSDSWKNDLTSSDTQT